MNEKQVNKIARKMGVILCESGMRMIRSAFQIDPYEFSKEKLGTFIKGELGIYPSMADKKYYTIDVATWNEIIRTDWTDRKKYLKEKYDCKIPVKLAYAWGLFCSDGTCNLRNGRYSGASWNIVNTNLEFLEKAKKGLEKEHQEVEFKIKLYDSYRKGMKTNFGERTKDLYSLEVYSKRYEKGKEKKKRCYYKTGKNKGKYSLQKMKIIKPKARGEFIKLYRKLFYEFDKKIVPKAIFDKYHPQRKAFLKGMIDGDGSKQSPLYISVGRKNPRLIAELDWHMFALGWKHRIDNLKNEFRIYYKPEGQPIPVFCDNFAYSFSARMAEIFGITGASIVHCNIYNRFTNVNLGGHFFTGIVAKEDSGLKLYFLEPMNDQIVEYEKGKPIIINNWRYDVKSLRFF